MIADSTDERAGPDSGRSTKPLVVGLGASAGGIEALRSFFAKVPSHSSSAYVVILHLSPDHDSKLAEVLQMTTGIPVTQVSEAVRLQADHVYVVPPNRRLEVADGMLNVHEITQLQQRRSPIDLFFRSLADAHGSRAVCVVLSGTGSDGSAGLKRVKEYGGLSIAQRPSEAAHEDMPTNAIATGMVDLVLPVSEMPARIADYHHRLRQFDGVSPDGAEPVDDSDALRDVLALLRDRTGHDFANYKRGTLLRRIQRRMTVAGAAGLDAYARIMREQPEEAVALMKDLLISVTHFFRDADAFRALEERVIPRLLDDKGPGNQVRVWVPACATGEEAYSVAMLLVEYVESRADSPGVQVFATDLDENAIAAAREGLYAESDVADLPEKLLERFFQREGTGYRIRRQLRETILFAPHNVLKDPPFSRVDLISCRNLLIYLNRTAQQRVLETFHFALRPGGCLLLGPSESPESASNLFVVIDRKMSLYQTRMVTTRTVVPEAHTVTLPRTLSRAPEPRPSARFAPIETHHRLLEQYAPPSLIVTEDHTLVHMSSRAARYLQMPPGEPSRDLLKLIRPDLRAELRTALYQASRSRSSVEVPNMAVVIDGVEHRLNLVVRPVLGDDDPARGFFLVLFADRDGNDQPPREVTYLDPTPEPIAQQLEDELSRVKAHLRTVVQQYEVQVEEAQAAAEEHLAMNEELRSAAEELETSKEELQSVNEELATVNQELKIKLEELRLSNNDFKNLINSTDISALFLDRSLRLKLTTPRAQDIFNVIGSDIGRPLSDITSRIVDDRLEDDLREALDQLRPIDREVRTADGRWYLMRSRPYRTSDERIDGIVLMFQDITARRLAELEVRLSEERMRVMIDSAIDYAIVTTTEAGTIDSWNTGAQRMFGYGSEEIVGQSVAMLFTADDRVAGVPAAELIQARRDGRAVNERQYVRRDGTLFNCSAVTTRLGDGARLGFATIARDLTGQQLAAEALRQAYSELDERVATRTSALQTSVNELQSSQLHVVNLLRKVVNAQEDERGRIARNLHDQLGQRLTALRLSLERVQQRAGDGPREDVERALDLTRQIDEDVGFLAWELRPAVLDHLGLGIALPRYVREWAQHYGVEVAYRGDGFQADRISREAEVALYRISQEALTNIAKHAHASRVDIMLETRDGAVVLVVEDDGVGFDPGDTEIRERGIGLLGMAERAGLIGAEIQVESTPGDGTAIFVRHTIPNPPEGRG